MRAILTLAIFAAIVVPAGRSQALPDQLNFLGSDKEGVHLYGLSAFFGYSALDYPQGLNYVRNRTSYGASGTVGWQRFKGRTNVAARYTGGFYGDPQNTNLNSFNQSAAISVTRALGSKWTVEMSASGSDLSFTQYLFEPSALGSLSQSTAGFDDLAAAFSIGQYSSAQAGVKLNQVSDLNSPTRALLLGSSILSYAAQGSVTYSASSRLQFHLSSFALGGQHRASKQDNVSTPNYILPRSIGGTAGVDMSYSLSTRTTLGVGVSQSYVTTSFQKSYATTASASTGRKMGEHWFVSVYGGMSFVESVQQAVGAPPSRQFVGGSSLGFRTYANTFVASYGRSASDVSTAAVGTSSNFSGAWNWHHPQKSWGLSSAYTYNRTGNTGYSSISGWRATFGFNQRLMWNLALSANYSYLRSRGAYLATLGQVNLNAIRVSISWVPHRGHWPTPNTNPTETLQ